MNNLNEMGMRKPTTSFNVQHLNKCLGITVFSFSTIFFPLSYAISLWTINERASTASPVYVDV